MSKKKDLINKFSDIIEDIMDHYDNYSEDEKKEIERFFNSAVILNSKLEHYDKKTTIWEKFSKAFSNFFGGKK